MINNLEKEYTITNKEIKNQKDMVQTTNHLVKEYIKIKTEIYYMKEISKMVTQLNIGKLLYENINKNKKKK